MTNRDKIKDALANAYELTRAELTKRTGLSRDQLRKPLLAMVKDGEVDRSVDEQGIEMFTEGKIKREEVEIPERVEPSLPSGMDEAFNAYAAGFASGYESAWRDIEEKLGAKIRSVLGISLRSDEDE